MTIKPDGTRMAFAAACLFAVLAPNSDAKLDPRQESLRGVQAIAVDISCSKDALDAGLTGEEGKTVEKQIERAGIKVMPKQLWDKVSDRSRLKVTVDVCRPPGIETFVCSLRLCFVQTVTLERSPQLRIEATTWELNSLVHSPKSMLAETVRKNLETMADSFIKDCRTANPPPGEQPAGAAAGNPAVTANGPSAPSGNSETTGQKYVASTSSSVFHRPDCRWAQNIAPTNLATYSSRDEALKSGKRPCKSCDP